MTEATENNFQVEKHLNKAASELNQLAGGLLEHMLDVVFTSEDRSTNTI